jgi:23S rRNA (adenine2503-C2)-methyltransferase
MNQANASDGVERGGVVGVRRDLGEPAYRGRQLFGALFKRRLRSFEEMTDLPKNFRATLAARATAATLTVESRYISEDGTRRYLLKTHDKLPVEAVFIPERGATRSVSRRNRAAPCSAISA